MRIILLRHGQYTNEPFQRLTPLGRKQARWAGIKLKEFRISEIYCSTMPRARETAQIVKRSLRHHKPVKALACLRECLPGLPKELLKVKKDLKRSRGVLGIRQSKKAFQRFFKPKKSDKTILLVCHGNIIRSLVCQVMGIDPLNWIRLEMYQCGFSVVEYTDWVKKLTLLSHNEIGHIPIKNRTHI